MGLEVTTTIEGLDESWPLGIDSQDQGDDHIRLLKDVLKTIFPGAGGTGFNKPITATEDDINSIGGLSDQLNAPAGTGMVFIQAGAPTGWTQITTENDRNLRLTAGAGGGGGGTDTTLSHGHAIPDHLHATNPHAITIAEMPIHQFEFARAAYYPQGHGSRGDNFSYWRLDELQQGYTNTIGSDAPHTHGSTQNTPLSTFSDYSPRYIDTILCSKD